MKSIKALIFFLVISSQIKAQLAANMYCDLIHAPFIYGVASGDPLPNSVIIWTKISTPTNNLSQKLIWEVSNNAAFASIVSSGSVAVNSSRDWTANVDAGNLYPNRIYYFRFKDTLGNYSIVGRTRTAPPLGDANTHARFATVSCSSIYSGFFNAYRRISEKTDLDFVMHLGDYIYDFVDADEEIRVPSPYPSEPATVQAWRDRHAYYLMDPDLREARRMHPWISIWDNHDLPNMTDANLFGAMKTFYEYVPTRITNNSDTTQIFRDYSYGSLMDIMMIDILTRRNIDSISPNNVGILGNMQYNWLKTKLSNSTAKWKIVGNQKMVCDWSVIGLPSWFPGNGTVLSTSSWDGFNANRDDLLNYIKNNNIDNVLFLSGDSHVTMVADLSPDPNNILAYNGSNGNGSVAAEFLPTSITRGNFDEMGIPSFLLGLAVGLSEGVNPHHVYSEFTKHGYGLINVRPDTIIAELWYSNILALTNQENFHKGFMLKDGMNHWERTSLNVPSNPKDTTYLVDTATTILSLNSLLNNNKTVTIYPNPSSDGKFNVKSDYEYSYVLVDIANGTTLFEYGTRGIPFSKKQFEIDLSKFSNGNYLLKFFNPKGEIQGFKKIIKAQ